MLNVIASYILTGLPALVTWKLQSSWGSRDESILKITIPFIIILIDGASCLCTNNNLSQSMPNWEKVDNLDGSNSMNCVQVSGEGILDFDGTVVDWRPAAHEREVSWFIATVPRVPGITRLGHGSWRSNLQIWSHLYSLTFQEKIDFYYFTLFLKCEFW